MRQVLDRLGWGIAGALAVAMVLIVANAASGGPLDPPGAPGSTDSVRLPGTPISGPTTIDTPGHYYLTRNISVSGADGIIVDAPNVSIDLGGFNIDGDDTVGTHGILGQSTASSFDLRNGWVTDFHVGIKVLGSGTRIDDVHAMSNIRGYEIQSLTATITDCTAKHNTEAGVYVLGSRAHLERCHVASNSGPGVTLAGSENVIDSSNVHMNNLSLNPNWKSIVLGGDNNTVRNTMANGIRVEGDFNDIYDTDCLGVPIAIVAGATNTNSAWPDHLNIGC